MHKNKKIRLIIVDDSAFVRTILTESLNKHSDIEVIATANDPYQARDKIVELNPDVITLDVEMPKMDGIEFLRKLMPQFPIPVIMVSSLTKRSGQITLDALQAGAIDFVTKPSSVSLNIDNMITELIKKIKIASKVDVSNWKKEKKEIKHLFQKKSFLYETTDKMIVIGASTGGTEALRTILEPLPRITPGIVIVQHMPPKFTKMFADRLNTICKIEVKEAQTNDRIRMGRALIAPGGYHMSIKRTGGIYSVICNKGENVCGHCPSVDVLMNSAANEVGTNAIGIMLTGMGKDGSHGMLNMHKNGAKTIAQNESSCVVYGMPKAAYDIGAVDHLVHLDEISSKIFSILKKRK